MVTIEQEVWGMTPEGEGIIRYTMRNESGASVQLSNYGATILSVVVPDRNGKMDDVVLGYRDAEGYFFDGPAMGKSVGRYANRIALGRMTIEGEKYQLEINNGQNHLHGGTKNFANRVWESRVETNRVVMSLTSEDGDQKFPGELVVEAIFDFDDENQLEITYLAKSDRTTVVNLTNHAYFNLNGEGSGTVLDHELQLNTSRVLEMSPTQIPTGTWLDVEGTAQDFRSFRRIGDGIDAEFNHIRDFKGYDHPFPIDGWKKHILGEVGALRSAVSGRLMKVYSSQPSVMIYTGNWLEGSPVAKSGKGYADYDGVAIECQNYPDAPNQPAFPSALLEAGELYCEKIVYRFETMN
ncbi:MAG: galactose mutarotase [Alistipes sp.]|nr:galactose mutarotase [Alistipes sp.]